MENLDTSRVIEKTLALIKPDVVARGCSVVDEILDLIVEEHGFTIVAMEELQMTRSMAEKFYAEHDGKEFFSNLVEFMIR